jgi:thermostable 8-oxoguanine DNA glycosylase
MSVRDVSNPKQPHLIPNMLGYILPNVRSDPERYYLIMMALFSPYHSRDNILSNPYGVDYKSYEASFFGFMNHLEENNPIRHTWLLKLMANMSFIREGSQQQQLERAMLEELKQAQNLVPPDVEGPYGNDADEGPDGATYATEDELADVMQTISHRYKHLVPKSVKVLVDLVSDEANIYPSMIKVLAQSFLPSAP